MPKTIRVGGRVRVKHGAARGFDGAVGRVVRSQKYSDLRYIQLDEQYRNARTRQYEGFDGCVCFHKSVLIPLPRATKFQTSVEAYVTKELGR